MKRTLLSLSLLALLASCANDDVLDTSDFITNVLITADDVQMAESESYTRTDLTLASGALQFAWAAEDVVGIYPNEGDQVSFPMTKGAGTKSANFDGGGWAVKSSCTYAAYFPYSVEGANAVKPVYTELPGWKCPLSGMKSEDEFPEEFNQYITFLEEELGTPISIVSVGPDREQTIVRYADGKE